jgi:hypothetical protein
VPGVVKGTPDQPGALPLACAGGEQIGFGLALYKPPLELVRLEINLMC